MKTIQLPRDTTAAADALILPEGVLYVDTTRDELRLHDGVTPGGFRLPNINALNTTFVRKDEGLGASVGFPETGTGMLIRVAVDNFIVRILAVIDGLTLTNADGTGGNPTLGVDTSWLSAYIAALHATAAQIRANTIELLLTTDKAFLATAFVVVTYAATVPLDLSTGFNFSINATGDVILGNPTNLKPQNGIIEILANGADRALSVAANWKDPSTLLPASIPNGTRAYVSYFINSLNEPVVAGVLGT